MASAGALQGWYNRLQAYIDTDSLPPRAALPRYLAPLPKVVEDIGLRLAWLVVAINLIGTAFGFWYYLPQLSETPIVMWPFVPDSPAATLLIACSIILWKLDHESELFNALAFFGCIKLGLWTPYTLLVFFPEWGFLQPAMYNFLFWSHLMMVVEAFVLYRYADFPVWAVGVALIWYTLDLIVDYFYPIVGQPHHTALPIRDFAPYLGVTSLQIAAAGAVVFTLLPTFLALSTRVKKLE